ncbi:MAG: hypothetical protein ABIE94_07220 [archaeon]
MDISNKSLVLLLVVAVIITTFGVVTNLQSVGRLTEPALVGHVTSQQIGNVSLTVTSQTSVVLRWQNLGWGSGYVNSTCNNCTMTTKGAGAVSAQCCLSGWSTAIGSGLLLENQGNTDVSLQINFTDNETSIGGTAPKIYWQLLKDQTAANPNGSVVQDTADSCVEGWLNAATWTELSGSGTPFYACGSAATYNYTFANTKDEVELNFNITIPDDATQAAFSMGVMFIANSA